MKRFLIIALITGLIMVSSGLVYSSGTVSGMDSDRVVHEYGITQSIVDHSKEYNVYILYPEIGIAKIDKTISNWAQSMYQVYRAHLMRDRRYNPNVRGELNIQYSSYYINDTYVGIVMYGSYNSSVLANPIDFVKTFNIDLAKEELLTSDEILRKESSADVVALLEKKLIEQYPELKTALKSFRVDRTWLLGLVLNHNTVDVLLPKSEYLPSLYGTVTVGLPLDELGSAFLLTNYLKSTFDPERPMVALTFDDGPSQYTLQILDILAKYDAYATFCMVGNRVETYADIVVKVAESGSEIVGHTWDHKNLTNLGEEQMKMQLNDTNDVIFKVAGITPRFFRPSYGATNSTLKAIAKEMNMIALMWSVDPEDWRTRDADAIYEHVMKNVKDGSIVLCHDLYESTSDAMERIIPALIEQGYQLVTVSELLEHYQGSDQIEVFYSGHR